MAGLPPEFGVILQPKRYGIIPITEGRFWALDNGAFGGDYSIPKMQAKLARLESFRNTCLFVVVPDVVGNANLTLRLWEQHRSDFPGWPLAFVAQDGQEDETYPADCSWVFIGGTDAFKLGVSGKKCILDALTQGKKVHVGRVNSQRRYRYFEQLGCHSADGTGWKRKPKREERLYQEVMAAPSFFRAALPSGDCDG